MSVGNVVSSHLASRQELRRAFSYLILALVLGGVVTTLAQIFVPPADTDVPFLVAQLGIGITLLFSLMIGLRILSVSRRSGISVDVCQEGLRIMRAKQTVELRYDDIAFIAEDEGWFQLCKSVSYSWLLAIVSFDKTKHTFAHGSQENFETLYAEVLQRGGPRIASSISKRLLGGETIKLSRLMMDSEQLVAGQTVIVWMDLVGVGIAPDGCIIFETRSGAVNCQRTRNLIPNWKLLPEIARQLRNS